MNVAVILTGHMRCWKQVFPNFKERIIDRYNPDIFIHTWDDEGWWTPEEGATGVHERSDALIPEEVQAAYNPVSLVVEKFDDYLPIFEERVKAFENFYHRPRNIVSMFYKMGAGVCLMEQHAMRTGKKYDLVIRMRPDMVLFEDLPTFEPEVYYTLAFRNHAGTGTGDMFQIGSMEDVSEFSKIGMHLETIYDEMGLLCPHVMSHYYIHRLGLLWQEFHVAKTLQHTPNGQYKPATPE